MTIFRDRLLASLGLLCVVVGALMPELSGEGGGQHGWPVFLPMVGLFLAGIIGLSVRWSLLAPLASLVLLFGAALALPGVAAAYPDLAMGPAYWLYLAAFWLLSWNFVERLSAAIRAGRLPHTGTDVVIPVVFGAVLPAAFPRKFGHQRADDDAEKA